VRVQMDGDSLSASGVTVLRQSDFGIKPLSVTAWSRYERVVVTYRIVAGPVNPGRGSAKEQPEQEPAERPYGPA